MRTVLAREWQRSELSALESPRNAAKRWLVDYESRGIHNSTEVDAFDMDRDRSLGRLRRRSRVGSTERKRPLGYQPVFEGLAI